MPKGKYQRMEPLYPYHIRTYTGKNVKVGLASYTLKFITVITTALDAVASLQVWRPSGSSESIPRLVTSFPVTPTHN